MNSKQVSRLLAAVVAFTLVSTAANAQRQPGARKGPASKIYVAETQGETLIETGDKIYTARQATAFDASGTVIETKENAHNAFVYSNGTGMYVDQNSRVEITRFLQEPFLPDPNKDALVEPSVSVSDIIIARGAIGICTSRLVSGSSMSYSTPHVTLHIRGGRIAIEALPDRTIIDLLEGDLTVRTGRDDVGGQVLRPGERAVVQPGSAGKPPAITIGPIPPEVLSIVEGRVNVACNARRTVSFETIERGAGGGPDGAGQQGGQDIVPRPTVPQQLPSNIVVSPDRLPGN
ncbi:MAG: hypothetical protein JNG83_08545 [Opitutaceae bacterium]|nr:hypothetical protein [Opitutaceae bacterium]